MVDVREHFPKRRAGTPSTPPNVVPSVFTATKPAIALGTMNFGRRTPEDEAKRIIDRAYERGVRVIDTANVYEGGESERIVGRALGRRREAFIIASKVGLARKGGKAEGLNPDTIRTAIGGSFSRLGVETIDLYYLHAPDHDTPIAATLTAIFELIQKERIGAFGVSNYASWQILEILHHCENAGMPRPAAVQQMYNLLVRQLDVEYFRFANEYQLHTTTYNALAGGLLARDVSFDAVPDGSRFDRNSMYMRRYWSRAFFEAMERYRELARESSRTLASFAYGWLAARRDVDSILIGPATVEQLDFALDAIARPLDPSLLERVDAVARDLAGTDATYAR